MSDTRVTLLTPPGTGAIATLAVTGPNAWATVSTHFRPASGKELPTNPTPNQFWFGTLGDGVADEVVVAFKGDSPEPCIEVHCHGGQRVVRWLIELFVMAGCVEAQPTLQAPPGFDTRAVTPLTLALTARTAGILLDQYHGTFDNAVRELLTQPSSQWLEPLLRFAPLGHHLVSPWKVVIAGPPNVGKSSLINALVGYQRSVVADVAGTTRDAVTATVALDGWPVELTDTAGLRHATESLESAGIDRAQDRMARADLVVWVLDATDRAPVWPESRQKGSRQPWLFVVNKSDQPIAWDWQDAPVELLRVSAVTGAGVQELASNIVRTLVPDVPAPGDAVPFTPELAERVRLAYRHALEHDHAAAMAALTACLRAST